MSEILNNIEEFLSKAVIDFWGTREAQIKKQQSFGRTDQGFRGAVTGGAQMNGVISLLTRLIVESGIESHQIFYDKSLQLPGYYRPTKKWDLLIVKDGVLIAALEAKSQVGPSFGNNFNNRTEEAMGSALDLWTAYREGAFKQSAHPWLGYFFLLEDCAESRSSVKVEEPHFKVFPEFKNASYAKTYEIFCRKLVLERQYNSAAFIMSERIKGVSGIYSEPAEDLSFEGFAKSLAGHISAFT